MGSLIKKLILLLLVLSACSMAGELIHFRDTTTSWNDVKSIAAKENKLIFIDAYTDWCIWCKVMDKETFTDTAVANLMNAKFTMVRYEMETGFGAKMSAKYRVNGFPTFLIFTPDGKLVDRILGFRKPQEFLDDLHTALDPVKQYNLTGISASLDPGFPEFYLRSFVKKEIRPRSDSATVNSYLASVNDLSGEVAWSVIFRFSSLVNQKYKDFVYTNYDRLKTMYGANDMESTISTFLASDLTSAIKASDESALERVIAASGKYINRPVDEVRFSYWLRFYQGTGRWNSYANLIDSAINSSKKPDENFMNSYAWTVYEKCDDKKIVARATQWMSEVIKTNPSYMILDTYAALLFKNGEPTKAKQYAELAIETGKKDKEDVQETEELLKKINASLEKKL